MIRLDVVEGATYTIERFWTGVDEGGMNWVMTQVMDEQWNVFAEASDVLDYTRIEWTATMTGPVYLWIWEGMSGAQSYDVRVTSRPTATPVSATTAETPPSRSLCQASTPRATRSPTR